MMNNMSFWAKRRILNKKKSPVFWQEIFFYYNLFVYFFYLIMDIRKKTNWELQNQANKFLAHVSEVGEITEKEEKKIAKILWLNESEKKWFMKRLSKKFWKEVDISDIWQIKHLLNKKNIDFWKLYEEYLKFLWEYLKARKKAKQFLDESELSNYDNWLLDLLIHICMNGNDGILQTIKNLKWKELYVYELWNKYFWEILEYIDKNLDAKNFAKRIIDKYPCISTDEFFLCFKNLSTKVLNLIFYKYPNLSFDEFKLLISHEKLYDIDWYNFLFKIFPNISFWQFVSIIGRPNNVKLLETLFWLYPNITISEFIFFIIWFSNFQLYHHYWSELRAIKWFQEKFPDLTIQETIILMVIGKDLNPNDRTILFKKYKDKIKAIRAKQDTSFEELFINDKTLSQYAIRQLENLRFILEKYLDDVNINWDSNDYYVNYKNKDYNLFSNLLSFEYLKKICERFPEISIWQLSELSGAKSENLEILLEKYPEIKISELKQFADWVVPPNPEILKIILKKYPNIQINELISLKKILPWTRPWNLEIIFKKYPNIQINELISLKEIIWNAESQNLEKIFERYPEIKISELNSLHDVLIAASCVDQPENLKIILEKYPNIQLSKLTLFKNIFFHSKPKVLKMIFEKYPNIQESELKSLEELLINTKPENLKIILEKYPNIQLSELSSLTNILKTTKLKRLNIILEKYPKLKIEELTLFDNVLEWDDVLFIEFLDLGASNPSEKSLNILGLFVNKTKIYNEIFKNIENTNEINDDNWIDIIWLYSAIEYFEDDKSIPGEIKATIRGLLQSDESKDFVYKKIYELLRKSLADNEELTNEEISLLTVLNKKWLWNMWQSESLAKFIYQINKLDKNYKFNKSFTEIKWGINKFINVHKKDSNELLNSFYQVSTSLLERSPAIYRNVVELLNKLNSEEQKLFYKEIFPLYNVELFLWGNPWQYKLLWKKVDNNVEWQLIPMHERIKMLLDKLDSHIKIDMNSLLLEEKNILLENIKQLFKEKFWIKKIPTEFSKENIESIRWYSIYLSNMHARDEEKSAVLWYFLALKLDGKRSEFRTWKDFDPSEYMDDSKVYIIREYLSNRSERNSVYKLENIEEKDKIILQENESNTIIWNTNWIIDILFTIESNIKTLLDDDAYSERQKIIKKYASKNVGKLLAKQFQVLSGRNIPITDEEKHILSNISDELWDDLTDIKNVQKLQNECKSISAILNFVNKILSENIPNEIQDFEKLCKPSNEHLRLLKKIWINLEDDLIISSNSYLIYIESEIRKWKNKLTKEEYNSLNEYILRVHKELDDLYGIKDKLTARYRNLKDKIIDKYFDNTELKERFESMSPYFFTKADVEKQNIVSLMTNDLDIVIKNIRECLWCKKYWCNNDTNLSFGCDDRFFITTSHREWDTSFADELVTLLPREAIEDWFTFVMDKIYWNNWSTDILLNNIYVIMEKINKLSPKLKKQLSIFVPDDIGLTLNEEWIKKIKKQYNWVIIEKKDITVKVEKQPITDSYHEFGGIDYRSTWNATISWYLIKLW